VSFQTHSVGENNLRFTLYFGFWTPAWKRAGNSSSDNRDNCIWPVPFVCAERFPHGCSCRDRTCRAWPTSGHASWFRGSFLFNRVSEPGTAQHCTSTCVSRRGNF